MCERNGCRGSLVNGTLQTSWAKLRDWIDARPGIQGGLALLGLAAFFFFKFWLGLPRFLLIGTAVLWLWFLLANTERWWRGVLVFAITSPLLLVFVRVEMWMLRMVGQP